MSINFNSRVEVPADVLVSELDGESVILNPKTESYVGLDEVGATMWSVVIHAESIEAAYEKLKGEWNVEPVLLRHDLASLLERLVTEGLLSIHS
jgi:hypothetical protein